MKKSHFVALSLVVVSCVIAFAQDVPQAAKQAGSASLNATKSLTVSGKVSNDGRRLLTDIDTEWAISNSEALKGREGSLVTVKCYVDPNRNQLHVLSVKSSQSEAKFASRQGDSAFRR